MDNTDPWVDLKALEVSLSTKTYCDHISFLETLQLHVAFVSKFSLSYLILSYHLPPSFLPEPFPYRMKLRSCCHLSAQRKATTTSSSRKHLIRMVAAILRKKQQTGVKNVPKMNQPRRHCRQSERPKRELGTR